MAKEDPKAVLQNLKNTAEAGKFNRGIQVSEELSKALQKQDVSETIKGTIEKVRRILESEIKTSKKKTVDAVRDILAELPQESKILLLSVLPDEDHSVRGLGRHLLANTVMDPNGKEVWETIKRFGALLKAYLAEPEPAEPEPVEPEQVDIENLEETILAVGILNTRNLNKKKILKIPGIQGYKSPREFFNAYKRVKTTEKSEHPRTQEAKDIALLTCLGAKIDRRSESNLIESINVNRRKANEWIKKILVTANKIMEETIPEGEIVEEITLDNSLETMGLYELAEIMFEGKSNNGVREEAQMLLRITLEMMNIRSSDAYGATQIFSKPIQKQFETAFVTERFEKVLANKLHFDRDGNITNVTQNRTAKMARVMRVEVDGKEEEMQAIWVPFDEKGAEPILIKMMTKGPKEEADDVRDHLRTSIQLPQISITDLEKDPKKKKTVHAALKKVGETIGLRYIEWTGKEQPELEPGTFTIEDCTSGEDLFKNMKLIGTLADPSDPNRIGTTIEVQANPNDLVEIEEGENSPFNHNVYDEMRKAITARNILSNSRRRQAHIALNKYLKDIKGRRTTAIASARVWMNEKASPNSPSPAPQEPQA